MLAWQQPSPSGAQSQLLRSVPDLQWGQQSFCPQSRDRRPKGSFFSVTLTSVLNPLPSCQLLKLYKTTKTSRPRCFASPQDRLAHGELQILLLKGLDLQGQWRRRDEEASGASSGRDKGPAEEEESS